MTSEYVECARGMIKANVKESLPKRNNESYNEYIDRVMGNMNKYGYSSMSPATPVPIAVSWDEVRNMHIHQG